MSNNNEWGRMICSFCGTTKPHTVFISIRIATDCKENPHPYSQTEMCKQCWDTYGIDAALEHNDQCREDIHGE